MATDSSFDVVSRIDEQELDNALNQARKEIENRFDFKHSKTSIEATERRSRSSPMTSSRCATSSTSCRARPSNAASTSKRSSSARSSRPRASTVRQVVTLRSGIPKDKSKALMEKIKSLKLKVNAQYQDEQIRVSGKSRDDLQKVIAELKAMEFDLPLQFVNYR